MEATIELEKPHLVFVSETWFSNESAPNIAGYVLFRRDRGRHAGGVAIYAHESIDAKDVTDIQLRNSLTTSLEVESVWCQVVVGHECVLVGCVYRTPTKSGCRAVDIEICASLRAASTALEQKKVTGLLIAGDFNLPDIIWSDGLRRALGNESSAGFHFANLFDDLNLSQHVCSPTFEQANGNVGNVLDLVLSESDDRVAEVVHGPGLGKARQRHHLLRWTYQLTSRLNAPTARARLNYAKGNYVDMSDYFGQVDWAAITNCKELEQAYTAFVSIVERAEAIFIPKSCRKPGKSAPWLDRDLRALIKGKAKAWWRLRASGGNPTIEKQYKDLAKSVKHRMRTAVHDYEMSLANDKVNPKRIYHYIKMRQRVKLGLDALQEGDRVLTDPSEIVNTLNDHFSSCFVVEPSLEDLPEFSSRTSASLNDIFFSVDDVARLLGRLDPSKSPGGDGMHAAVLKHCAAALAIPLCTLFRRSLDESYLPCAWLNANVTPLYKKGARTSKANYRPISLTSVVCKVMERMIRDCIMSHLQANKLLAKEQHGFVPRKSCTTNLLESGDLLTKALAQRGWMDVLFLDFAKAFDTVPHRRLLAKLEAYGIGGKALSWIRLFLANRRQRVVIGDHKSDWANVTSGVPQGSVIGSLLFVIYINDLPEVVHAISKLYADDTKLHSSDSEALQRDIDAVVEWCCKWLMALNASKCHILHVGKCNPRSEYNMQTSSGRQPIASTTSERDLGVYISEGLKVGEHVHKAAAKANSMLGVMKRTFVSRDAKLWKKLYTTHVRPHMEYAVQAWCPYQRGDIAALEQVQRRATKIPRSLQQLSYINRLAAMNLMLLEDRRLRGDLIQSYKLEQGLETVMWHHPLVTGPVIGGKRGNIRREIVSSCAQRHNFFTNRVAKPWNQLPDNIVNAPSINSFKAGLDRFYDTTNKYKHR